MAKIIAVVGATGAQGGSVAREFLKMDGWKVRGITRNVESEKAKALASEGAEVVSASLDDEASLVKAFEGASVIFGLTNFWELLYTVNSPEDAGAVEVEQAQNLARAAAKTPSLEHFLWSTLPNASAHTNGKYPVPHLDYKAKVDEWIRSELPELHAKTTYVVIGYYPNNILNYPMAKPFQYPDSGKWVQVLPTRPTAKTPLSGDINKTPGIYSRHIITHPEKTKGKYVKITPEVLSFGDMLKIYGEVLGRPVEYVQTDVESYSKLWGLGGKEFGVHLEYGEQFETGWGPVESLSAEELGIDEKELQRYNYRSTIEALKDQF